VVIVGAGRLGTALAAALSDASIDVAGPLGRRDEIPAQADAVLLCVPESQLSAAAAGMPAGPLVGHCSGASTLAPLAPHEAFSLHPLMTVTPGGADFTGATAAIAGSSPRALATARSLAEVLGMRPVTIDDEDRAAYHAAASVAANFLVTLEGVAERLAATAGMEREPLVELVRASVENWARDGAAAALTGPIARGDEDTVARQREAVAQRLPDELELFDALAAATRRLAASPPAGGRMKTVRTVAALRQTLAGPRRAGRRIGLVPTMGALHEGHLSLIRQARAACDEVVVSLFVNPAQFNEAGDLAAYPRDEARDAQLAAEAGADVLFAPPPEEVYPGGFATTVSVAGVTAPLEGEHRGGAHFDGVATVVAKLLNMAQPDVAFFGQKDAQQVAVIRRLVRDLDIPARIEVGATVREPDGLALSSRNALLPSSDRQRARALRHALDAVQAAVDAGATDPARITAAGRAAMRAAGVEPEYLELVAPDSFTAVPDVNGEPVIAAVAARVGDVRLIDNEILTPTHNGSH
jgi:pantoate--beta-alanine ligase